MGEQTSGLMGKFQTQQLQTLGVPEAEIMVEVMPSLIAEVCKRLQAYGIYWRTNGDYIFKGQALYSYGDELAKKVADKASQYLCKAIIQAAVQRATQQGARAMYYIKLDVADVDLSGLDQAVREAKAEHEQEQRLQWQVEQVRKLANTVNPQYLGSGAGEWYSLEWQLRCKPQPDEQLKRLQQLAQLAQQREQKAYELAKAVGGEVHVYAGQCRGIYIAVKGVEVEVAPEELDTLTPSDLMSRIWAEVKKRAEQQQERISQLEQENKQLRQIVRRWCDLSKVPEVDEQTIQLARLAREIQDC
jgi:signal transduction histidine kinase